MRQTTETTYWKVNGFLALLVELALWVGALFLFVQVVQRAETGGFMGFLWGALGVSLVAGVGISGFFLNQPNEARALIFFGRYLGTIRDAGFWWSMPLVARRRVSLRIRNFNSERLKVNDARGNPVEIGAVVVWRVVDTARALFDVDDYVSFVAIQSETAIRGLATSYPYDGEEGGFSLRGSPHEVAERLREQVQERLAAAGVEVTEARISHLAYATEIAQAMLRRQQAEAIIAARKKIVQGAVGMVQHALQMLADEGVVELDEERKAAMVNNLLVALVSEQDMQPVVNTGTLFA